MSPVARRVRVLSLIGDLGFGGAENRLLALARYIDSSRFEHTVMTINGSESPLEETAAMRRHYSRSGIRPGDLAEKSEPDVRRPIWQKGTALVRRVRKLACTIRERDIDLLDCHLESAALLGTIAALLTRRRSVVTLYHPHPLVATPFWSVAEQFIYSKADAVITDSAIRGREIQQAACFKRPDIVVVPNGVLPPHPSQPRHVIRKMLGIPDDPNTRVIGQVSALRSFKGQLVLMEAAQVVLQKCPNALFLMVGYVKTEPEFKRELEQKAAELGIAHRVRIASYPGPIGDVWSTIDIHVHASLFDSLPNAIIEGMSLRKPAAVTAVGGIPDAVAHEQTGLVVPPGNAAALAEALMRLLNDSAFAEALGRAAFNRYRHAYRPDLMARKLESCFLDVLTGRGGQLSWKE